MSIRVGKYAGFCFGVSRAVQLVEQAAEAGKRVCTLGPIIHNRHVVEKFAAMGKKAVPLKVSAAFHSALMQPAADEFYEAAKGFTFAAPQLTFYSNLTGGVLTDFSDMPSYLARHIVSPVRFTDELAAMQAAGFERYLELGPGKTLTGLVKRTLSGVTALNVENAKTLAKATE